MYDYLGEHPSVGLITGGVGITFGYIDLFAEKVLNWPVMQLPVWMEIAETGIHIALMIITGAVAFTTLVSWIEKRFNRPQKPKRK